LFKSIHCNLSRFSLSNVILSEHYINFAVSSNGLNRVNFEENYSIVKSLMLENCI
jgi:hypothetical protein